MGRARSLLWLLGLLSVPTTPGCSSAPVPAPKPAANAANTTNTPSWARRSVWVQAKAGRQLVFVVGRAPDASLDESSAMDSASQDARENLALYLKAETAAIRVRAGSRSTSKSKESGQPPEHSATAESSDERLGATLAAAAVSGLEIVDSTVDARSDTQLVLGQLDLERYRGLLGQSDALTPEERDAINQRWEEVGPQTPSDARTAAR